jgi:hypothetical protein
MSDESNQGGTTPTQQQKSGGTELMLRSSAGALARVCSDMKSMQALALSVYESAWFGCKTPHSAMMVVATMVTEKLSPVAFKAKYWVLPSGPSIKAEWMLAEFNRNYGTSQVIACTAERACIELKRNNQKKSQPFEFTWEEAKHEPYVWTKEAQAGTVSKTLPDGKDNPRACKDNWGTPAGRRDMLWARVVSAALRKVCPEVISGVSVAEESDEYIDTEAVAAPHGNPGPTAAESPVMSPAAQPTASVPESASAPPPESTSQSASPALAETPAADPGTHETNGAAIPTLAELSQQTPEERKGALMQRLAELFYKLRDMNLLTKDRYDAVLQNKYRVSTAKALNDEQLSQLVFNMAEKLKKAEQANDEQQWADKATGLTPAAPT